MRAHCQWATALGLVAVVLAGCSRPTPEAMGIPAKQWAGYSEDEQRAAIDSYHATQRQALRSGSKEARPELTLRLVGGQALLWPGGRRLPCQTSTWRMVPGRCQNVTLRGVLSPYATTLNVCYLEGTLFVDPSRTNLLWAKGSLRLHHSVLWHHGHLYGPLATKGYAQLKGAHLWVQDVPADHGHA